MVLIHLFLEYCELTDSIFISNFESGFSSVFFRREIFSPRPFKGKKGGKKARDMCCCFFSKLCIVFFLLTTFIHAKGGKGGKKLRSVRPLWWCGQHCVLMEVPDHHAWTKVARIFNHTWQLESSWANGRLILTWLFYLIYSVNYKYNVIKYLSICSQLLEPQPLPGILLVFFVLCVPFMSKMLLLNCSY